MHSDEGKAEAAYTAASQTAGQVSLERAVELWLDAADQCRRAGSKRRLGDCLNNAGVLLNRLARGAEADTHFAEALSAYRAAGEPRRAALVVLNHGISLLDRGEVQPARERIGEALALLRDAGDEDDMATALIYSLCMSAGTPMMMPAPSRS